MRDFLVRWASLVLRYSYARFLLVGIPGGVINAAVFQTSLYFGFSLTGASVAGSYVSHGAKMFLFKTWVFESRKYQHAAWQFPADLVLKFVWNAWFAVPFLLHFFVEQWNFPPLLGQIVAGWIVGLQNYVLYRLVIYSTIRS